jgi:hypothetical membrane protein
MTARPSPDATAYRLPRLIPARPAGTAFAACVVVTALSDLGLSAAADRWVATTCLVLAGVVVLLADLAWARSPHRRLLQLAVGGGCIASGIAAALGVF